MLYRLIVWERSTGLHHIAGEMVCDIAANGRAEGAFRYAREYLEREDAFALDPVSLPLKAEPFSIAHPGIFGVFEDSLPDDWGRKLLVRKHNIPRHEQNLAALLSFLGSAGLGALSFSDHGQTDTSPPDVSARQLSALLRAAEQYERGAIKDSDLALLLGAGSSPGGARPKALVYDEGVDTHYLAKFPSIKDNVDVVRIEAATISLAAKAGLVVPATTVIQCGGKPVLLVERFDIIPSGRRHMISLQTLLRVQGYYQSRYLDILNVIRKYSAAPLVDSERLFRQMVYNAVIGNTDDHLKNFWMVHSHTAGWRLSPSFDLVPDIGHRVEHVLFFDLGAFYPGRRKLEHLGRAWGIPNAASVVEQVFSAVKGWKAEYAAAGVTEEDINRFREIDSRLDEDGK